MMKTYLHPLVAVIGILGVASTASAQFKLHAWYNFEDSMALPKQLVLGHHANADTLKVGVWNSFPSLQQLAQNNAMTEVGAAGLVFHPSKEKPQISLIANTSMDRRRLQPGWKALYQADFFLDAPGQPSPTMALLAITPKEGVNFAYNFYRFGILEGGEALFFSFANATPEPVLYSSQPLSDYQLQRPGWHRFQIIFEGPDQIAFAIDTIPTSFSPITETTLPIMHPGLMVSGTKLEKPIPTLVDNLSIQWTSEPDSVLPESPWTSKLAGEVTEVIELPGATPAAPPIFDEGSKLNWHEDRNVAWADAQAQGKPILTLFYAPKIQPYSYLKSVTPTGPETEELLNKFVLLRVDANQLAGGKLAADFRVVRLPTFVVIGTNSQEKGRAVVVNNTTTWDELSTQFAGLAR